MYCNYVGPTNSLAELKDALQIRNDVFVIEQGYDAALEVDDHDFIAVHAVFYEDDGTPVATGRLFLQDENQKEYALGRIAVQKEVRKDGIGSQLLQALESKGKELGANSFWLSAQKTAQVFYEKNGYVICGEESQDQGVPHVPMKKSC